MIPPKFPETEELQPWLDKLNANQGSCVVLVVEVLETQNWPRVSWAWLSGDERAAMRRALLAVSDVIRHLLFGGRPTPSAIVSRVCALAVQMGEISIEEAARISRKSKRTLKRNVQC